MNERRKNEHEARLARRVTNERVTRKCGSKKRFGSKRDAISQIKNTFSPVPLYWYKCAVCRGFHLTRRPRNPPTT